METIAGMEILLPARAEQDLIVRATDDAEELIGTLERLIAKKQAIKQGTMQQLLTGKTRLPGFSAPWQEVRLGDVLSVRHGRNQKDVEEAGGKYPILATGGEIGRTNVPLYSKPSVLIGRKGTIDRPQFRSEPFWTVDTLFYTEITERADPKYLYYVFLRIDWRSMNEASGVPSLSSRRIEDVRVSLPVVDEQRELAAFLDDAELEIDILRNRLKKTKAIKQGMMQELLSGRTRLPGAESEA